MIAGPFPKGRERAKSGALPENVGTDAGHAAVKRKRDYEGFADPASPQHPLLCECGQHGDEPAGPLAIDSALRFLKVYEMVDADWADEGLAGVDLPQQRFIEVTGPITIESENFRFVETFNGLEVIPKAGTVIAYDGEAPVATPYDDCVLIMPSRRLNPGASAVRLGRYVEVA